MARPSTLIRDRWKSVVVVAVLLLAILMAHPPAHAQAVVTVQLKPNSDPDCVSWGGDRIDCFVRGSDGALWHASETSGTWSPWESWGNPPGGSLTTGPSAISTDLNELDVYAGGPDGGLWHVNWFKGVLSQWYDYGGTITSDPDCVFVPSLGERNCFAVGTDNAMWRWDDKSYPDSWHSWGGVFSTGHGPGAAYVPASGQLYVNAWGNDGAMYENYWDTSSNSVSNWQSVGGILTSDPDCASWGENELDCFVRGTDNAVWWHLGTASGSWVSLGGQWSSGPTVASRGINSLDVFALGMDNILYQNTYSGSTAWSGWQAVPMTTGQVNTISYFSASLVFATTSSTTSSSSSTTPVTVTDWALLSVGVDPPNPQAGGMVTFSATLALLSSTMPLPLTVYVQCQLDGQPCGAGLVTYPGPIGQPFTVHADTPWAATPGNHIVTWSVDTTNDPTPADNVMSATFTVQPLQTSQSLSTTSSSVTASTPSSSLQVTVIQTQTVTQPPTSTSMTQQATTQLGLLDMLQQNSLPLIAALAVVVVVLAVALMRRGRKAPPEPAATPTSPASPPSAPRQPPE